MNKNIPTEEDFARASAAMRERDRGLSEVSSRILQCFQKAGLHEFFIFYSQEDNLFGAYLFYSYNRQINEADESGLSSKIKTAVIEELERVGRGNKDTIKVDFEFDSHENVKNNFEGDYYLRLR